MTNLVTMFFYKGGIQVLLSYCNAVSRRAVDLIYYNMCSKHKLWSHLYKVYCNNLIAWNIKSYYFGCKWNFCCILTIGVQCFSVRAAFGQFYLSKYIFVYILGCWYIHYVANTCKYSVLPDDYNLWGKMNNYIIWINGLQRMDFLNYWFTKYRCLGLYLMVYNAWTSCINDQQQMGVMD